MAARRRWGLVPALIAAMVLVLSACGSSDKTDSKADPQGQARLVACVDQWNGVAGDQVRGIVGGLAQSAPSLPVRVFAFAQGTCGVTAATGNGLGTYVVRGGHFEPYINTRGQGFGQSPDRKLFAVSQALEERASAAPNATVGSDGVLAVQSDATLPRENASPALTVQNVDGSVSADQPYVLDAQGFDALSRDDQLRAIAAYAADRNCPVEQVTRIASAIRDGSFQIVSDSLESTLSAWCAGDTPAASGQGAPSTATPPSASLDVGRYKWDSYSRKTKRQLIKQFVADIGCDLQSATRGSINEFVDFVSEQLHRSGGDPGTARDNAETLCKDEFGNLP